MRTILNKKKAGFTLVELMVVAIIVAILAAVAIPLMSGNKRRAAATEAESALGTVRSALRAMYAETGRYDLTPNGTTLGAGSVTNIPGILGGDLAGKYWQDGNYTITAIAAGTYTIQAASSTNPIVSGVSITLNEQGNFSRSGL